MELALITGNCLIFGFWKVFLWMTDKISVYFQFCTISIKNFSENKCKKFHVSCMLLSERIGVKVS